MAFTYDPSTGLGRVRLLIADTNQADPQFEDAEIEAALSLQSDNIRLAAAMLLDVIASNETLILKRITTLDLKTDGPAVAASLREHAKALRKESDDDGSFDIADVITTSFGEREFLFNQFMKES